MDHREESRNAPFPFSVTWELIPHNPGAGALRIQGKNFRVATLPGTVSGTSSRSCFRNQLFLDPLLHDILIDSYYEIVSVKSP